MPNLNQLDSLPLEKGKFAIFGSGVLSVRGIRESDDIDILVSLDLWDILTKQFPDQIKEIEYTASDKITQIKYMAIEVGDVEIMKDWIHLYGQEEDMIKTAEIIDGYPFVKLDYFKERKQKMGRDKDKKDLELLNQYEKNHK